MSKRNQGEGNKQFKPDKKSKKTPKCLRTSTKRRGRRQGFFEDLSYNFIEQILYFELYEEQMLRYVKQNSFAWKFLTKRFGENLNFQEINSLALVCANNLNLPRPFARNMVQIIKWYDDYIYFLEEFITNKVVITDKEGNQIVGSSEYVNPRYHPNDDDSDIIQQ